MGRSFISRCSLAKAIIEPEKLTEPISPPSTASAASAGSRSPRRSSTAAMVAAAPPPMPL